MLDETDLRKIELKVDAKLDEIADFLFSKSQENIIEREMIDEGTLLKSGFVERYFLEKKVGYYAPHASWNEFGTEPHMPPVEPIMDWAKRRLGLPEEQARKVAWAIAMTIKKEGMEPRPFFRDAIEATKQKYAVMVFGA